MFRGLRDLTFLRGLRLSLFPLPRKDPVQDPAHHADQQCAGHRPPEAVAVESRHERGRQPEAQRVHHEDEQAERDERQRKGEEQQDRADELDDEADDDEEIGEEIDVDVDDEDAEAPVEAEAEAVAEAEEEVEAEATATASTTTSTRGRAKRVEVEALHTVAAREDVRKRLAADVEAFLKRGGSIQDVAQDVRADPPKKPESNYGRGSI